MLLAALGSVRIGKNCDLGLENAALGLQPRAAFSRPRSQFFPIRTSQPANNIYLLYGGECFTGNSTTRRFYTPLHPGPEWRIFRMSPLRVSYRSMTSRIPPFAFVELVSPYNKKNITHWLEDMNFMFSWEEQYLTSERSERVHEILFLPREHKIHIFEPTCNVLFIIWRNQFNKSKRRES